MFQSEPFDIKNYTKDCLDVFGIVPRPHWMTTEFGGHVSLCYFFLLLLLRTPENQNITVLVMKIFQDIKTVLGKFASNIIFSNGLRDPYSIGG